MPSHVCNLKIIRDFSRKTLVLPILCFIARRGTPAFFVTNNFESFKSIDVKEFILKNRIKWEFILERYPWWGDFKNILLVLLNPH